MFSANNPASVYENSVCVIGLTFVLSCGYNIAQCIRSSIGTCMHMHFIHNIVFLA